MEMKNFRRASAFALLVAAAVGLTGFSSAARAENPLLNLEFNFTWVEGQNITQFDPVTLFYKVDATTVRFNAPLVVDSSPSMGLGNSDATFLESEYQTFGLFGVYTREVFPSATGEPLVNAAAVVETGVAVAFVLGDNGYPLGFSFESVFDDFLVANPGATEASIAQALIDAGNSNPSALSEAFASYIFDRSDTNGVIGTENTPGDTMTIVAFSDGVAIGTADFDVLPAGGGPEIPEPASLGLLGLGAMALIRRRGR